MPKKFTAGPWAVDWRNSRPTPHGWETYVAVSSPDAPNVDNGNTVVIVYGGGPAAIHPTKENVEATAVLVAAAPDLHDACEMALNWIRDVVSETPRKIPGERRVLGKLQGALQKASIERVRGEKKDEND